MMNIGAGTKRLAGFFAVMLFVAAVCGMLAMAGCETPADGQSSGGTLDIVWKAANSPAAIAAIGGLLAFGLGKLYLAKPEWKKYEGTIIAAVKKAEKEIPDGTAAGSLSKLDMALKYVIAVYEQTAGKTPDAKTIAELTEGVQVIHADLEANGIL